MTPDAQYLQRLWDRQQVTGRVKIPPGDYTINEPLRFFAPNVREVDARGVTIRSDSAVGHTLAIVAPPPRLEICNIDWIGGSFSHRYPGSGGEPALGANGVEFINCNACRIDLDVIAYCDVGLTVRSIGRGASYTRYHAKRISAKTGVKIMVEAGGWANGNWLSVQSLASGYADPVYIDSQPGCDTWYVRDTSIEGIRTPAHGDAHKGEWGEIRTGSRWEFLGCRYEAADADKIVVWHPKENKPYAPGPSAERWLKYKEIP